VKIPLEAFSSHYYPAYRTGPPAEAGGGGRLRLITGARSDVKGYIIDT
jgi:hypothetical protein